MRNAGLHDAHLRAAAIHFTDSYIAPTGHTYGDGVVTREPTCTREGEMTYTCSCGKTHTEPIAKLAHSYVPQIVEPDVHGAWLHGLCLRALRRPDDGRLCPRAGP